MSSRLRLAVLITILFPLGVADAQADIGFASCRPSLEHSVECATLSVALDRTGVVPGSMPLYVERIRAEAKPAQGVMFVLSGGPGESVSAATDVYADMLATAHATRDLILVDQRGTGLSGALTCPDSFWEAQSVRDYHREAALCGTALGTRLPLFTTPDVVEDLETVRRELGVEQIELYGVSYGTRTALAYAARYPQHVSRLVLDSVVPLGGPDAFRLNSLVASSRVLREHCAVGCAFTADPAADLAALVRRVAARGPLVGKVARGDGRLHPAKLGRTDLLQMLLIGDFLPELRTHYPGAVRSALDGDVAPLLRLRENTAGSLGADDARAFSVARFLATICAETSEPWLGLATAAERDAASSTFLAGVAAERFGPFDSATALASGDLASCRGWPGNDRPPVRLEAPLPDVPALLINGTLDLRTPVEDAAAVAAQLPRAQLLPVRGAGHAVLANGYPCAHRALASFLSGAEAGRCGAGPRRAVIAPAPRRATDALRSVVLTLDDVLEQVRLTVFTKSRFLVGKFLFYVRAGGLRGGRYSASDEGVTLERLQVVPGVVVSGRIAGELDPFAGRLTEARGKLTVRAKGRTSVVEIGAGRIRGTLSGRKVDARLVLDAAKLGP